MQLTIKELKEMIKSRVAEAKGAMRLLDVLQLRLVLSQGASLEDIITDIRVIKGIATVNQDGAAKKTSSGQRVLDISVSFDPQGLEKLEYIDAFAHVVKKIPNITMLIVKMLNDTPVRDATGKSRLIY
jgi:hypothetical protein